MKKTSQFESFAGDIFLTYGEFCPLFDAVIPVIGIISSDINAIKGGILLAFSIIKRR
jgi:hypothetical protein